MNFPFKQTSRDFLWKSDEAKQSFRNSLSEGSSKLFGSLTAKKDAVMATGGGIFNGISSQFDKVVNIVGGGESEEGQASKTGSEGATSPVAGSEKSAGGVASPPSVPPTSDPREQPRPKQRPPKPPAPKTRPDSNGGLRQGRGFPRQHTAPVGYDKDEPINPNAGKSFEEPSYPSNRQADVQQWQRTGPQKRGNPFLSDHPDNQSATTGGDQPGSDLLPGIPRNPSTNASLLGAPAPQGRDLLVITPTSGAALPIPSIKPSRTTHKHHSDEIFDDSDGDSEDTEGCDEVADVREFQGGEGDQYGMVRSGSATSDRSWDSQYEAEHLDEISRQCLMFMKEFVQHMFDIKFYIGPEDKARFGEVCQHGQGRLWFARYVNVQRVNQKKVEEQIFYRLVQFFAICLFESKEEEDYVPAKHLMNMCFTFYFEAENPAGPARKHYLYSYMKDQPIWQSLRFWNAAFFDAVQRERARRPMPTSAERGQVKDDREYQENITFGQLGTFTCNMRSFGLSRELCLEFLRKQSTIANLKDEQVLMLRENIER